MCAYQIDLHLHLHLNFTSPNYSLTYNQCYCTASIIDDDGRPIIAEGKPSRIATPFNCGGGHINPIKAQDPGLVYDINVADYYKFYSHLRLNTFSKSTILQKALDLNLPSVYITNLEREEERVVRRAVTNVGKAHATYTAIIDLPARVNIAAEPKELRFNNTISHHSFKLKISTTETAKGVYKFGYLAWVDGKHVVRIPIVICIV